MKKAAPYLILVVLAIAVLIVKKCKYNNSATSKYETINSHRESGDVNRDRGFDRRISYLQYSNHAKCRMACRHITQDEVEETLKEGKINYRKSDIQNSRCPRYAVEEVTKDNQRVRIVFAQCNNYTEVVTVIDLDTEWTCDCPGDDNKYKNGN
jgi:hypothetical protein